ncbi:MAG: Tex family protein [Lachnospiraceae bacterium]|nr:Tex family protein [Lachnospiraceae bacterium]
MDIIKQIAIETELSEKRISAAVQLMDEGNTVPFIARYRKEATGALNDEELRKIADRLSALRNLEEKKETARSAIEAQGKLTPGLAKEIEACLTQVALEDIYRPYKQKKRTRAMIAREKGLQGLADFIRAENAKAPLEQEAGKYLSEEVTAIEDALSGASDIIAEEISDDANIREQVRRLTWADGTLVTAEKKAKAAAKEDSTEKSGEAASGKKNVAGKTVPSEKAAAVKAAKLEERRSVYEQYFNAEEVLKKIPGHRVLAINRGEKEGFLSVKVAVDEEAACERMARYIIHQKNNAYTAPFLQNTVKDAYERLIAPAIEREIRNDLTEKAEDGAIAVFAENTRQLLMQQPLAGRTVLGWDPAFRTGCKLAVVDPTGKVLDTTVIYPTAPQNKVEEAEAVLDRLVNRYDISVFSVGNGTASRESEQVIADFFEKEKKSPKRAGKEPLKYVIVSEAGASVYSASPLATEEFPNFDVGQRSAASIARRLQDPLAELVKIDPKAMGVGQYQHDMNQKKLGESLTGVVESCVNAVGVDLNTASFSLLSYVAGITPQVAKNIVSYREENGRFRNRRQLLKVPKLGPKAFEQCAGFLRITGGDEPLDATGVHPESYAAVKSLLQELGYSKSDEVSAFRDAKRKVKNVKEEAEKLGLGVLTLTDILNELEKPGRDPREDAPAPILKAGVLSMEDLTPGMHLKGTVRNVVDFGAFVDIGVHEDGLVHISKLATCYVKNPMEVVKVGDIVDVTVLSVDPVKKRISLSMVD